MEKTDIKIRAVEAAVFLAGCCVSLFFVLGFDFKPAPNKSAVMSVEFYPLLLLLTLAVTSVGYALLLVRFFLEKKR